jgi:hypothetical protein
VRRLDSCLLGLFITPVCSLLFSSLCSRTIAALSSSNAPPRAELAVESIDNLPSYPSLITKTGTAILDYDLATAIAKVRRFLFALDSSSSSHHQQDDTHLDD